MTAEDITREMRDDAYNIERWVRQIENSASDSQIQQLAGRIRHTARDIFDS